MIITKTAIKKILCCWLKSLNPLIIGLMIITLLYLYRIYLDTFCLNPLIIGSMIITETADDVKETAELKSLNPLIIGSMIITAPSINKIPAPSKYVLIPLSSGQ
mgnify:FL=1